MLGEQALIEILNRKHLMKIEDVEEIINEHFESEIVTAQGVLNIK